MSSERSFTCVFQFDEDGRNDGPHLNKIGALCAFCNASVVGAESGDPSGFGAKVGEALDTENSVVLCEVAVEIRDV